MLKENPNETSAKLSNASVQMLDFNGDGFTDMVDAVNKKIYVNKGNGKWEDSSASLQNFPVTGKDPNMRFMDYDGDKKIDVISSDGRGTTFWVSDGKGNWVTTPGKVDIGLGFEKDKLRLIDINGDGLQDVVHITKNTLRYRKYLGYGQWTDWINVTVPKIDQFELSTKAQFADINGDGMADMVAFLGNAIVYFVNKNGEVFEAGKKLETFKGVDIPDSSKMTIRIVDINGNGSRDIVWIDSSGRVTYLELFGKRPNLMEAISNGIGQRINVEYGSSVYFYLRDKTCKVGADKACAGPWKNKMPMAFTVVTKITTWSSRSSQPLKQTQPTQQERPTVQEIYYHDGFYDGKEKKFRGFRKVENVQVGDDSIEQLKETITYDVGDKDPYFHGKLLHKISSNAKGKVYQEQSLVWKDCPLAGIPDGLDPQPRFICQASGEFALKEGLTDKSKWKTLRRELSYDGYGNVIGMRNLGVKDKQGDEQLVKTTFLAPKDPNAASSKWFLRLIQKREFCNETAKHCAEVRYFYDGKSFEGLPAGQWTRGNVTRVSLRVEGGKDAFVDAQRRGYDSYGNAIALKNSRGLVRKVAWDEVYHRFPTHETIDLGKYQLSASTQWDYSYARVIRSVGYNGQITRYTYDAFGRLLSILLPGDDGATPSITYSYQLQAPLSRIVTQKRTHQGGKLDAKEVQCYDGQGRKLAVANLLDDGKYLISNHREFNARGQLSRNWHPYLSERDCQFAPPTGASFTRERYDAMGRRIHRTYADGTFTRTVYKPLEVWLYDEEDNRKASPHYDTPKVSILDGLQRVLETRHMLRPDHTITTRFAYTNIHYQGRNLTTAVTFADGSQKKQVYDLLGRIVSLIDPDRSTTHFSYDSEGNLLSRQERGGAHVVFTHDLLNRPLSVQEKGKPQTRIAYAYDLPTKALATATHLKSRIARVSFPGGSQLYSYDARGQLTLIIYELDGVAYPFKRSYDNAGRVIQEIFPDGRKLQYTWDTGGRLKSIPGKIAAIQYGDRGNLIGWRAGNGVETSFTLDARMRYKSLAVAQALRMDYTYDATGNVLRVEHKYGERSFTHSYTYDALYRLTQASLGDPQEVLKYRHDDLHNILSRSSSWGAKSPVHMGKYSYDAKRVHAATQIGAHKLAYDGVGRLVKKGDRSYKWDFLHRRVQVLEQGQVVGRDWYGADARRVIKQERGKHTLYITPHYGIRDGRAVITIPLGKDRVAAWYAGALKSGAFEDLAPATGQGQLKPQPDGKLTAADAWLHHAGRKKLVPIAVRQGPLALDQTRDLLQASLQRLWGGGETTHYFHADHLGSVRLSTDQKGQVIGQKDYYPYGYLRSHQGAVFSYGFMGTERDALTKANAFLHRFMDTQLARWISPDPAFESIGGPDDEFNSYGITRANPLKYRDIDGTESLTCVEVGMMSFFALSALYGVYRIYDHATRLKKGVYAASKGARRIQTGRLIATGISTMLTGFKAYTVGSQNESLDRAVNVAMTATSAVTTIISTVTNILERNYAKSQDFFASQKTGKEQNTHSAKVKKGFRLGMAGNATTALGLATTTAGYIAQEAGADDTLTAALIFGGMGLKYLGSFIKFSKGAGKNWQKFKGTKIGGGVVNLGKKLTPRFLKRSSSRRGSK